MATPAKAKVDPKPMCKYGANCYRKSEQHLKNYRHPRDDVSLSCFLLILCLLSLLSVLLKEITSDIGAKMPCLFLSLSLSLSLSRTSLVDDVGSPVQVVGAVYEVLEQ